MDDPDPPAQTSALELAVLASARSAHCPRPASELNADWTLIDQIEIAGTRYVLARCDSPPSYGLEKLSAREREVLRFLADGQTTKEAAYELGIADATVRVLLVRAMKKLGTRKRNEAIARYLEGTTPIAAE